MQDDLSPLKKPEFVSAVNEFGELLLQTDKAFLLGAGCSKCAGLPLTTELMAEVHKSPKLDSKTNKILRSIEGLFKGAANANIEDYLSELVDLKAIAERRDSRGAPKNSASISGDDYSATELKDAVDQIKEAVVEAIDVEVDIDIHRRFIQAVHRPSRPGRKVSASPVDYLVLNYDTLIESALALEKLTYADGMNGGNTAWWDGTTYDMDGIEARVLKLHGSIDWKEMFGDPLPRRVPKHLTFPAEIERKVLIWPASTKYRETQRDPYAQLSTLARSVLRPKFGRQTVLTICGYSFIDSHINIEIEEALRESGGELTLVVFTFDESPEGEIKRLYDDQSITDQVRIYARKGFFHGATKETSDIDLPWCKFENITRILEGER